MNRLALSPAASGILRELARRSGCPRDRIRLAEHQTVEWQSLTFVGERHALEFRIGGPDAADLAQRMVDGLDEAEFSIAGQIVADIRCSGELRIDDDGCVAVCIDALTVED